MKPSSPILQVKQLITSFETSKGLWRALDQVSFSVDRGKMLGIVGESGCGKSVTAMSLMRLLPQPMGKILGGSVMFKGRDLLQLSDEEMIGLRGNEIGMIFQEPMTALNPLHRVGKQIMETLQLHQSISKKEAWNAALEMMKRVKIPDPEKRMMDYPHQLSGGMKQRVVIAQALIAKPALLIADEPTTALDVTVQAQILKLIQDLQKEMNMACLIITHDLGVVAQYCDEVMVMYAGRVVEYAPVKELFERPLHAYTKGLLSSIPTLNTPVKSILPTIPGMVASLNEHNHGCRFCQRLGRIEQAQRPMYQEVSPNHWVETCPQCYQS